MVLMVLLQMGAKDLTVACEVVAVDPISASDIGVAGALLTKRNLSCISVRPCRRPHGCDLGEGEVPLCELGVEQDRPCNTASCCTCGITSGPRLHCAGPPVHCTSVGGQDKEGQSQDKGLR